ncbi:hypothetical protein [Nostoc sp.]|uniref:hypothetical protein n=1 Tax=Nostoc sp. TaxID=1180 RepID=UPI002FF9AB47
MTTQQPDPLIDLSHAKEPPRSLDIDKAQEADQILLNQKKLVDRVSKTPLLMI